MSTMMGDWLGRNLFDSIPDGIPALDPEEDDEDGLTEADESIIAAGGWCAPSDTVYAPASIDTSSTVGFFLTPQNEQDLPGPEDPKHATLLYLGHIGGDGAPDLGDYKGLLANVGSIAARERQPFKAEVKGIEQLGDEGAQVWMLSSPEMVAIRNDLLEIDSEVNSLHEDGTFTKYPEFKPHVTIGYPEQDLATEDIEEAEQVKEITFDRLGLWFGGETLEWNLGSDEYTVRDGGFPMVTATRGGIKFDQPRGEKGTEKGGQFKRPDVDSGARTDDEDGDGFQSEAERRRALVKSILAAMDDIMDDLTSAQARELIRKVKANAKAFLDAQVKGSPGGGAKSGPDKGKGGKTGTDSKDGKDGGKKADGKSGGSDSKDDKGGDGGPLKAMINALAPLLKQFGQNMKAKDRAALTEALDDLKEMD